MFEICSRRGWSAATNTQIRSTVFSYKESFGCQLGVVGAMDTGRSQKEI